MGKRIFDFAVALFLLLLFALPMLGIAAAIRLSSKGPVIHWSKRVGKNNIIFKMPKFRTMQIGAPDIATHLMKNSEKYMTSVGHILRKASLDELPQLWSVLKGDMSMVGPRPALYNQDDLVALRTKRNIHKLTPGITGWAQINGRDEVSIPEKVVLDEYYLCNRSFTLDMKIMWRTIFKVAKKEGVTH
ncbi:MAG TPA: sugar transferase [Smithellaceae bacterium]|nr:sugar transferase [Smithellaceae bacterium]HRS89399.1 sugar transferase [Smithellaceae bacterium]HRV26191.1 sugar transferase [Smithellaceae bacterium]